MGMSLTPDELRDIATAVETIKEARLNVKVVNVASHDVHLKRSGERENISYAIVGITNHVPGMR